jgi:RimJ/RimL family protein N-acetyltransferase
MGVTFEPVGDDLREEVVQFLCAHEWPFHARSRLSTADAAAITISAVDDVESFTIREDGVLVGLVRLLDLGDMENGSPLFDLRIATEHRERGIGREAVTWLSGHLFGRHPELHRIEATTREDNVRMMTVLERCGYRLEGTLREAWRSSDGTRHDAMIYGLLRREWRTGT